MITYRASGLFSVVVFFAILLIIFSATPDPVTVVQQKPGAIKDYVPTPKLPTLDSLPKLDSLRIHLLRPSAHKPPEQKNSTGGGSKWHTDWKWLHPFSSSITLEEDRSVLPPLPPRQAIYTYYDPSEQKEQNLAEADSKLLFAWRRAWYAQGFRPVVLGKEEAKANPLYKGFHSHGLEKELRLNFMEWLAWGQMGGGIFANWRCFPMAPYDDGFLTYLRQGSDPKKITRVNGLGSMLFSGEKDRINEAIKTALGSSNMKGAKNIIDLLPPALSITKESNGIAFYDTPTIKSQYAPIAEKLKKNLAEGRFALASLINSHLQFTFQETFSSGIAVVKPYPEYTTALVSPGVRLANLLTECAESPIPKSCPPNNPRCNPCESRRQMKIHQPHNYANDSSLFTLGVLPHPYTLISLQKGDTNITTKHIRRNTERDPWLMASTKSILGKERGGFSRVVAFKDLVAGEHWISRGLWFTVETLPARLEGNGLSTALIDDLDWHFGFSIPRKTQKEEKEEKNKEKEKEKEKKKDEQKSNNKDDDDEQLNKEYDLIQKARDLLKNNKNSLKGAAEAWNMADTEVWRFVRAYRARSVVERERWQRAEKGFVGS